MFYINSEAKILVTSQPLDWSSYKTGVLSRQFGEIDYRKSRVDGGYTQHSSYF